MSGDVERTEGGDPVCWLDRVCPQCGAFRETADPRCVRCGTPFPGAGPDGDAERTALSRGAEDSPDSGRGGGATPSAG
jgi:hypothetical protein